ncbi:hypothetical protein [Ochrobactrum quorumnocens]|uniref:TrbC/VIRB2 family protein n=1 Tax=Ochrobactrum quorumnocens TaxID=271865 RepID=A0A5N1K4M6_9HYPH|nr:hypothetical protein [[Ochrobactrum] quorumnocens]KAA9368335.1 hypothetical protein F3W84_10630 [[Ochrobactrum] quorumnocens]MBD7991759.1 hypothetical protein [Ochrobactrum gallinarum]
MTSIAWHKKLSFLVSAVLWCGAAFAQQSQGGIGEIATNLRRDSIGPIADLIGALAFLCGVLAAIFGLWTLFQNRRNPHDPHNSVGRAIMSFVVAAGLIGIPSYLGVGVATFFGSGAETASVDGTLRSIK